jgi:hypothetical protein
MYKTIVLTPGPARDTREIVSPANKDKDPGGPKIYFWPTLVCQDFSPCLHRPAGMVQGNQGSQEHRPTLEAGDLANWNNGQKRILDFRCFNLF